MLMEDSSPTFVLWTTSFFCSRLAYCEDGGVQLEGSQIVETSSYVYLGRSMNMENDLKEELNRRMRAASAAFAAVRDATNQNLRAHRVRVDSSFNFHALVSAA
ncbi:hypothetical protein RB195_022840 [Necator americanus]|uniref:Uncharacterized protein n=1 Tax=Necator americanus TaxID=51031 RepID=A0ABR1EGT4_NECAM